MFCAIDMVAVPITIGCILAGIAVVGGIALYDQRRKSLRGTMPHGAEAALWSITEVLPDPRNHLAIKDPTSELRLTDEERRQAADSALQARLRASASDARPATRAAAERSALAREAALAKRDELAREKVRRELAEREITAREADDREGAAIPRIETPAFAEGPKSAASPQIVIPTNLIEAVEQRELAARTDTAEIPQVVIAGSETKTEPKAETKAEAEVQVETRPAITFDSPEIVERLQALSAEALATDSLFASLNPPTPPTQAAHAAQPAEPIDLREDTGEMHAAHPRAS